MTSDQ